MRYLIRFFILTLSFTLFMFLRCNFDKEHNAQNSHQDMVKDQQMSYDELITKELNSDTVINNIFLCFEFGDSKPIVKRKFGELVKGGKVIWDKRDKNYLYNFQIFTDAEKDCLTRIITKFHNDKLVELVLDFSYEYDKILRQREEIKRKELESQRQHFPNIDPFNKSQLHNLPIPYTPMIPFESLSENLKLDNLYLALTTIYKEKYLDKPWIFESLHNSKDYKEYKLKQINRNREIVIHRKGERLKIIYLDKKHEFQQLSEKEREKEKRIGGVKDDI